MVAKRGEDGGCTVCFTRAVHASACTVRDKIEWKNEWMSKLKDLPQGDSIVAVDRSTGTATDGSSSWG